METRVALQANRSAVGARASRHRLHSRQPQEPGHVDAEAFGLLAWLENQSQKSLCLRLPTCALCKPYGQGIDYMLGQEVYRQSHPVPLVLD